MTAVLLAAIPSGTLLARASEQRGGQRGARRRGARGLLFKGGVGGWRRNLLGQVSLPETPGVQLCKIQKHNDF